MWCCLYELVSSICCFTTPSTILFSSRKHLSQWSQHLLLHAHTPTNGFRRCSTVWTEHTVRYMVKLCVCVCVWDMCRFVQCVPSFTPELQLVPQYHTRAYTHSHTCSTECVIGHTVMNCMMMNVLFFHFSSNTSVSVSSVTQPASIFAIQLRAHLLFGSNPAQDQDPDFFFFILHGISRQNVLLLRSNIFKPE